MKQEKLQKAGFLVFCSIMALLAYQYIYITYRNNQIKKEIEQTFIKPQVSFNAERYKLSLEQLDNAYKTGDTVYIIKALSFISHNLIWTFQYELAGKYILPEMLEQISSSDPEDIKRYYQAAIEYYTHIGAIDEAIRLANKYLNYLEHTPFTPLKKKLRLGTWEATSLTQLALLYLQSDSIQQAIACINRKKDVLLKEGSYASFAYYSDMADIYHHAEDTEQEYFYRVKYVHNIDSIRQKKKNISSKPYGPGLVKHFLRLGEMESNQSNTASALFFLDKGGAIPLPKAARSDQYKRTELLPDYIALFKLQDSLYQITGNTRKQLEAKSNLLAVTHLHYQTRNEEVFERIQLEANKTELERVVSKHREEMETYLITFSVILFICLITISMLYYVLRNKKRIQLKNETIYRLSEQESQRLEPIIIPEQEMANESETEPESGKEPEVKHLPVNVETLRGIFILIEKAMNKEQLYLDSKLKRSDLAKFANTNSTYIYMAIKHCTTFSSLNDYINSYRIKHACMLLKKNKNHNIESIALESGFVTRQTCYRAFSQHLSMTPKEYMRIASKHE